MRFIRFLIVGVSSAAIQFMALALCLQVFDFRYQFAVCTAYIASVSFHFFANRTFTFHLDGDLKVEEIFRYSTLVVVNLLITLIVTGFVIEVLGSTAYLATVVSIVATIGVTYLASKYWVFKRRGSS